MVTIYFQNNNTDVKKINSGMFGGQCLITFPYTIPNKAL